VRAGAPVADSYSRFDEESAQIASLRRHATKDQVARGGFDGLLLGDSGAVDAAFDVEMRRHRRKAWVGKPSEVPNYSNLNLAAAD